MRFTKASLKSLAVTDAQIENLRARQRGGVTGSGGYEYQRRFAVLRVLELAANDENGTVSMEALCPVDDVVVESGMHHEHSQVKESPTETWGKSNNKLRDEFVAQAALMKKAKVASYNLQVVTPHAQRAKHFANAPKALKSVVRARHFPYPPLRHQPWTVPHVATQLEALLVVDALSGASQREHLWAAVNHACGNPWVAVRARDAVRAAGRSQMDLPLRDARRKSVAAKSDVAAAVALLNAIPLLNVRVEDGVCFFVYAGGIERRLIARIDDDAFARFIERILQRKPSDYPTFYAELP